MQPTAHVPNVLRDYVNAQLTNNVNAADVRQVLLSRNWPMALVEQALPSSQPVSASPQPLVSSYTTAVAPTSLLQNAATQAYATSEPRSRTSIDTYLQWVFIGGFASIFLVNGVIAWIHPQEFIKLLSTFPLVSTIGHADLMITFAGLNDVVLGTLILTRKWQKPVLAWAGMWLALVTLIKLVSLI